MAFKMKGFNSSPLLKRNYKSPLKKTCNCWKGYSRVKGKKPCAPGSCKKNK